MISPSNWIRPCSGVKTRLHIGCSRASQCWQPCNHYSLGKSISSFIKAAEHRMLFPTSLRIACFFTINTVRPYEHRGLQALRAREESNSHAHPSEMGLSSKRRVGTLYVPTRCVPYQLRSRGQNKERFARPTNCTDSRAFGRKEYSQASRLLAASIPAMRPNTAPFSTEVAPVYER